MRHTATILIGQALKPFSARLGKYILKYGEADASSYFTSMTWSYEDGKTEIKKAVRDGVSTFDFVSKDNPYYPVKYRAVRFKIDGAEEYESVITNLDKDKFPADEIKKLYNLRWGIEISFRHLKYSADLSAIHARNRNSIRQEIWARILLYNLCMIMIQEAIKHKTKSLKYVYTVNITRCIHVIRDLAKRKGGIPPDLEKLLLNELLPIRPDRLDPRKVKFRSVVCFNYRFS